MVDTVSPRFGGWAPIVPEPSPEVNAPLRAGAAIDDRVVAGAHGVVGGAVRIVALARRSVECRGRLRGMERVRVDGMAAPGLAVVLHEDLDPAALERRCGSVGLGEAVLDRRPVSTDPEARHRAVDGEGTHRGAGGPLRADPPARIQARGAAMRRDAQTSEARTTGCRELVQGRPGREVPGVAGRTGRPKGYGQHTDPRYRRRQPNRLHPLHSTPPCLPDPEPKVTERSRWKSRFESDHHANASWIASSDVIATAQNRWSVQIDRASRAWISGGSARPARRTAFGNVWTPPSAIGRPASASDAHPTHLGASSRAS